MYRIRRFGVIQTATTVAAIYIFVVALFAIPLALIVGVSTARNNSAGALGIVVVALLAAAIYGVLGWVVTAIGCVVYNLVSGWVGGIEVQLDPVAPPPPPPVWGPITSTTPPAPPAPPSWGPTASVTLPGPSASSTRARRPGTTIRRPGPHRLPDRVASRTASRAFDRVGASPRPCRWPSYRRATQHAPPEEPHDPPTPPHPGRPGHARDRRRRV